MFFIDILVYSKNLEEYREHLSRVLEILETEKLYANKKKCVFGRTSVEYLGHIISGKGVAADPSKVMAITSWPTPRNV